MILSDQMQGIKPLKSSHSSQNDGKRSYHKDQGKLFNPCTMSNMINPVMESDT